MRNFIIQFYHILITERPNQLAAALAYFGMFSFAPVIFVAYSIAGIFIDQIAAAERLYQRLEKIVGTEVVEVIRDTVATLGSTTDSGSWLVSLIGTVALLFAASGLFYQLQFALNSIWKVPPPQKGQTLAVVKQRLFSFLMVIGVGLVLVLAVLINFFLSFFSDLISEYAKYGVLPSLLTLGATLGLFTFSFALIYKILPDVDIAWKDVWIGSFVTACMFLLAGFVVGLIIRFGSIGSAFEAAGAFAMLLVLIYYCAQIFLMGAVFIQVYANNYGSLRERQSPEASLQENL